MCLRFLCISFGICFMACIMLLRVIGSWNGRGGNSLIVNLLEDPGWGSRYESCQHRKCSLVEIYQANALDYSVQAETDELARKVEALNAGNESLKSEINRLTESSDRLRVENASLMVHPHAILEFNFFPLHIVEIQCLVLMSLLLQHIRRNWKKHV